jgi:hypothetical protein
MTFEEMMAALDKRSADWKAEREAAEAVYKAERERKAAEYRAEREAADAKFWANQAKIDASLKKVDQSLQALGSFQRHLGSMVEFILIPKIRLKINRYGHNFTVLSPNKQFTNPKTGNLAEEIDLLLENCDEALAIEIKSDFKVKDVGEHLRQLKFLRKNESVTGMKGRALYAGIAGISISEAARKSALKHGMYVITIHEDEERVDVLPPEKKGRW